MHIVANAVPHSVGHVHTTYKTLIHFTALGSFFTDNEWTVIVNTLL